MSTFNDFVFLKIKNSAIAFKFVNNDLGPLKSVTIRHDNKGGKASWFVNQVCSQLRS